MSHRRPVLVVLMILSLVAVAGSPAAARPPPESVCQVCGNGLADSAAGHGLEITPGESTLTIDVFENGTSRWTARVDLRQSHTNDSGTTSGYQPTTVAASRIDESGPAAIEALETDNSLRHAVVTDAGAGNVPEPSRNLTSSVSNGTLVVRYWRANATESVSDGIAFDAFDPEGSDPGLFETGGTAALYGGANEVVLNAPAGYRITDGPDGESVTANATTAVWAGETSTGPSWQGPSIDYTTVTFAPNDTATADGSATDPPTDENAGLLDGSGPVVLFSILLALLGVVAVVRRRN